jgi:hypothetical protein
MHSGWTWNKIADRYEQLATHRPKTAYTDYAQGMLELLPYLRSRLQFGDLRLGMAAYTLTVGLNNHRKMVHIDWDCANQFSVYVDHCGERFYSERLEASLPDAVETIEQFLEFISKDIRA